MKLVGLLVVTLLAGCGDASRPDSARVDPIYDAPPVPQEVLDRVLAEPTDVPRRPTSPSAIETAFGDFGERLGAALEAAASTDPSPTPAGDDIRVILFTADWCTWCRPARQHAVPWLEAQGYVVEVSDVTRGTGRQSFPVPRSLPAWVFFRNGREIARQEGGYLPQHLQEVVKKAPVSKSPTVGAWFGPTVRVADLLPLVAGTTLKLGTAATVSIPRDLKWTVAHKPGSVVLSFDPSPQVTVHKILNWRVRLQGVEITPTAATLHIDNLPDVKVKFDWSCPARTSSSDVDVVDDMHSAAAPQPSRRDRPVMRFIGRTVLFTDRVCAIASFVLLAV